MLGSGEHELFGPFVLETRLAIGGTSHVYRAHRADDPSRASVLVKRLLPSLRSSEESRTILTREAELHALVPHPNIVHCHGAGYVDDEPYLVMELIDGVDLGRVLRALRPTSQLPPAVATFVAREVLAALGAIHEARAQTHAPSAGGAALGLVHRDVSPSNVFLSRAGEVKLGDFGIAKLRISARTPAGNVRGKLGYLAPEQVTGAPLDGRTDLFAIANVLAETMLGRPLFPGAGHLAVLLAIKEARLDALRAAPHNIPAPLVAVLERALARDPSDRYPTARAFADALAPFGADASTARLLLADVVEQAGEALGEPSSDGTFELDSDDLVESYSSSMRMPSAAPVSPTSAGDPDETTSLATTAQNEAAPSWIRLQSGGGERLGPYSYPALVELIVTGKLGPDDEVDFMGSGFSRLVHIDYLARHVGARTSETTAVEGPGAPDWRGFAAETTDLSEPADPGIAAALSWIASHAADGVLLASTKNHRKELYFLGGMLTQVAALGREDIGEVLLARGIIDRARLDRARQELVIFGGKVTGALLGLKLVEPMLLDAALRVDAREQVAEIFHWTEGSLAFYRKGAPAAADVDLRVAIGPLIEAGVASLSSKKPVAQRQSLLDRRVTIADATDSLLAAEWSDAVRRVLDLARSRRTMRNIVELLEARMAADGALEAVESARLGKLIALA